MEPKSLITTRYGATSTADDIVRGADLSGRHALVTGASSGIGAETARALASAGAAVTLAVRNVDAGLAVADSIAAATGRSRPQVRALDLADPDSVASLVSQWDSPLDILVNNAGLVAGASTGARRRCGALGCDLGGGGARRGSGRWVQPRGQGGGRLAG